MKILVTNDDGILAPGLAALVRYLAASHDVFVVAPDNERSGVSQSITYRRPVFHKSHILPGGVRGEAVNGYPVDCVKVAIQKLCPFQPDVVVSGINSGLNVGLNVGHSGTVSGALAASVFGFPAIAVSLEEAHEMDFERAAEVFWPVCHDLILENQLGGKVLNVNIPTAALSGTARFAITPVNTNNMGYHFTEGLDPKGRPWLWQTNDPPPVPYQVDCDVYLCRKGVVTISPLSIDLTCHQTLQMLQSGLVSNNGKSGTVTASGVVRDG